MLLRTCKYAVVASYVDGLSDAPGVFRGFVLDGMLFQVLRLDGISHQYCRSLERGTDSLDDFYVPLISKCTICLSLTRKSDVPGRPGLSLLPSISPCALQVGTRSITMPMEVHSSSNPHTQLACCCAGHWCRTCCMGCGVSPETAKDTELNKRSAPQVCKRKRREGAESKFPYQQLPALKIHNRLRFFSL